MRFYGFFYSSKAKKKRPFLIASWKFNYSAF